VIVHRDDIRVVQPREQTRLAFEATGKSGIGSE
jgi:hypothetical protein